VPPFQRRQELSPRAARKIVDAGNADFLPRAVASAVRMDDRAAARRRSMARRSYRPIIAKMVINALTAARRF
jgi:hypothetical protein